MLKRQYLRFFFKMRKTSSKVAEIDRNGFLIFSIFSIFVVVSSILDPFRLYFPIFKRQISKLLYSTQLSRILAKKKITVKLGEHSGKGSGKMKYSYLKLGETLSRKRRNTRSRNRPPDTTYIAAAVIEMETSPILQKQQIVQYRYPKQGRFQDFFQGVAEISTGGGENLPGAGETNCALHPSHQLFLLSYSTLL